MPSTARGPFLNSPHELLDDDAVVAGHRFQPTDGGCPAWPGTRRRRSRPARTARRGSPAAAGRRRLRPTPRATAPGEQAEHGRDHHDPEQDPERCEPGPAAPGCVHQRHALISTSVRRRIVRVRIISTRIISWAAFRICFTQCGPPTTPLGLRLFTDVEGRSPRVRRRPRRGRRLDPDVARAHEPEGVGVALPARPRPRRRDRGPDAHPPPRRARAAGARPPAAGSRRPARRPRRAHRPRATQSHARLLEVVIAFDRRLREGSRTRSRHSSRDTRSSRLEANVAALTRPSTRGTSQMVASGGSVTSAENGCPCSGDASAVTPRPLPTSEPGVEARVGVDRLAPARRRRERQPPALAHDRREVDDADERRAVRRRSGRTRSRSRRAHRRRARRTLPAGSRSARARAAAR